MVSVVIVSWNTRELTIAAVASALAQQTDAEVEVIVVDNGSVDGSVAALRERFAGLRVIAVGRNLGFSGGNNVGLARARGEYTLLLNSDAALRPGALQALLEAARQHPEAGALQPRLVLPDGSLQWVWDYLPGLVSELWMVLYQRRRTRSAGWQEAERRRRDVRRCRALGFAAVMIPAWVWRRTGPLPAAPFLYFEEPAFVDRLRRWRLPIYLVPTAEVDHLDGRSTGQVPYVKRRSHYHSRMWFYDHYRDRFSAAVVRLLSAARAAVGILARPGVEADELWRPVLRAAGRRG